MGQWDRVSHDVSGSIRGREQQEPELRREREREQRGLVARDSANRQSRPHSPHRGVLRQGSLERGTGEDPNGSARWESGALPPHLSLSVLDARKRSRSLSTPRGARDSVSGGKAAAADRLPSGSRGEAPDHSAESCSGSSSGGSGDEGRGSQRRRHERKKKKEGKGLSKDKRHKKEGKRHKGEERRGSEEKEARLGSGRMDSPVGAVIALQQDPAILPALQEPVLAKPPSPALPQREDGEVDGDLPIEAEARGLPIEAEARALPIEAEAGELLIEAEAGELHFEAEEGELPSPSEQPEGQLPRSSLPHDRGAPSSSRAHPGASRPPDRHQPQDRGSAGRGHGDKRGQDVPRVPDRLKE